MPNVELFNPGHDITFEADRSMTGRTPVDFLTEEMVTPAAAGGALFAGVTSYGTDDDRARMKLGVARGKIIPVLFSVDVSAGQAITPDGAGGFRLHDAAAATPEVIVGRAYTDSLATEEGLALIY